ncbi:hypothetical protein DXG03_006447 [Asterophora parasitica]|uniref:Uncharacterized protein n=1 Tax=Asterophora parasitica TaxID=117018 RepID=A0A9P7K8D5_9AGAR|nr:hypothetical protein DXG03_006447 [Asterophora parasitica]
MWSVYLKAELPSDAFLISRLRPAVALADANIPCIVWGEEALAWIHGVPTYTFNTLHLLVPETQIELASNTLTRVLPEYAPNDPRTNYPFPDWLFAPREKEKFQALGRFPYASPLTVRLSHTRLASAIDHPSVRRNISTLDHIVLTPDSFFHLSATDTTSLVSLPSLTPPSLSAVRFSSLPTMYDALFSTISAPERSEYSTGLGQDLDIYLGYLHLYYFSEYVKGWYKELKDLPEPIREVSLALRAENQPRFWEMWLKDEPFEDASDDESDW